MDTLIPTKNKGLIPQALPRNHPTTHQVFGTMAPADLPATLMLPDIVGPVDQGDTSICYAYCTRQLCSTEDGVLYDENWNIEATSEQYGFSAENGAPALVAMQAMITYGPLLATDAPAGMTWQEKGVPFLAQPSNWPAGLHLKAAPHEQSSVLSVAGPYDAFDNIRAQICQHNRPTALATRWYLGFDTPDAGGNPEPNPIIPTSFVAWHMYEAMGFDVVGGNEMIWVKPHIGTAGKNGYECFDRATINTLMADTQAGAFLFGDVPQSVVSRMQIQNLSLTEIFDELAARIEANL